MGVPDAGLEAEERAAAADEPSVFSGVPPAAPVVQIPSSGTSSWFKDDEQDDDDDRSMADDARTETAAAAPIWSPSEALRADADDHGADDDEDEDDAPTSIHSASSVSREAAAPDMTAGADTGPSGPVTQTLIFQAVPNFQAALALERSLKAMSEVREVRVADFDERQLTFQVTHELGGQLPRVLLTQRGSELELLDSRPERVEFVFRS
jgi:hypothetical protein